MGYPQSFFRHIASSMKNTLIRSTIFEQQYQGLRRCEYRLEDTIITQNRVSLHVVNLTSYAMVPKSQATNRVLPKTLSTHCLDQEYNGAKKNKTQHFQRSVSVSISYAFEPQCQEQTSIATVMTWRTRERDTPEEPQTEYFTWEGDTPKEPQTECFQRLVQLIVAIRNAEVRMIHIIWTMYTSPRKHEHHIT